MEEMNTVVKNVLTAMDAASLTDNKNYWDEKRENSINRECTRLRDENKIDELIKYILESIETYANEGKYELNIVFNDGRLMNEEVMKKLTDLKYRVFIKTMTTKRSNGVNKVDFVNSISWEKPEED